MKHIVFYDAKCPFCFYVKKVFRTFDWLNQIKWVSIQEAERGEKYPYLNGRPIADEIHMLTKKGEIKQGFYTVRKLLLVLPLWSVIGVILHLPGMDKIGSPLYQWFSAHRHQWFGRYDLPRYA